jgi:hypothetical protein
MQRAGEISRILYGVIGGYVPPEPLHVRSWSSKGTATAAAKAGKATRATIERNFMVKKAGESYGVSELETD